jgi:hypothetical protein
MKNDKIIIGNYERVSFPVFGIDDVVAKIDTGAYSGAFHCTKISENTNDGVKSIVFSPFDHPEIVIETQNFSKKRVKSSNGETEDRYLIVTDITIAGKTREITLSLSDRSSMQYPLLIGSKFLRQYNFLVDATLNNS